MNNVYDATRYKLMIGAFDWTTANLRLTAWSGEPIFVPTDQYVVDVETRGAVNRGVSMAITGKQVAPDGTGQTDGVVIPGITIGDPVTFFTMSDMDELILFIDEAIELPFIPNGLDLVMQPDWLTKRGWWRP